jgi:hypothetical protein
MGLNDRINQNFVSNVDKSKSEIWNAVAAKIKKFSWAEFLLTDPIDYREFEIKDATIQVLRRPRFYDPFRPFGRIIYEMDENGKLKWQVRPHDNNVPIVLLIYILGLVTWTVLVLLIGSKDYVGIFLFLLLSWTLPGLMIYLRFKFDQVRLVEYGHRIVKELTEITGPAANKR